MKSEAASCPLCKNPRAKRVQIRKNKIIKKIIFLCKKCKYRFTLDNGFLRFRHAPQVIEAAINLQEEGYSLSQVKHHLSTVFQSNVSRKTLLDWKRKFFKKRKIIKESIR